MYTPIGCGLGGTQNCSDDATNTGGHVGTSAVAGLTASDGTATDSTGLEIVQVLFPAVTNPAVKHYFGYRSDDAAGTVGLTLFGSITHVAGATLGFVDDNANLGQDYYLGRSLRLRNHRSCFRRRLCLRRQEQC